MKLSQLKTCPCCGQTIASSVRTASQRHAETVLKLYGVTLKEMQSRSKVHIISLARNHYWFLLIVENKWSLTRAGESTGHGAQPALQGTRRIANRLMGTHMKMPLNDIRMKYWTLLGHSEEEAAEKVYGD